MALKKCPLPSPTVETISRKLCQRGQKKGDKVVKARSSKVRTSIKVQWSRKTESDFAEVLPGNGTSLSLPKSIPKLGPQGIQLTIPEKYIRQVLPGNGAILQGVFSTASGALVVGGVSDTYIHPIQAIPGDSFPVKTVL